MAKRPPITAAIDLTPEVLNALKQAGPNERGKYCLDMAAWENTRATSSRAPNFTGSVKLKGGRGDGPIGFVGVWVNLPTSSEEVPF